MNVTLSINIECGCSEDVVDLLISEKVKFLYEYLEGGSTEDLDYDRMTVTINDGFLPKVERILDSFHVVLGYGREGCKHSYIPDDAIYSDARYAVSWEYTKNNGVVTYTYMQNIYGTSNLVHTYMVQIFSPKHVVITSHNLSTTRHIMPRISKTKSHVFEKWGISLPSFDGHNMWHASYIWKTFVYNIYNIEVW